MYADILFLSVAYILFISSVFYCEDNFNINIVNLAVIPFRVCSICVLFKNIILYSRSYNLF